jgi:hypothetical protein
MSASHPSRPCGDFAAAAESPYRSDQQRIQDAGPGNKPGYDGGVNAEHLSIKPENEVVNAPAQHDIAEMHVVEGQEVPPPEQQKRRRPGREDVLHRHALATVKKTGKHPIGGQWPVLGLPAIETIC